MLYSAASCVCYLPLLAVVIASLLSLLPTAPLAMVYNTGSLNVKVVPDSSPLEVSARGITEISGRGVGLGRTDYSLTGETDGCAGARALR